MSISYTSISNSELHRLRESANREAKVRGELEQLKKKRASREREIRAQNEAEISRLNDLIANLKRENHKARGDAEEQVRKLNADFVKRLDSERERVNYRIDTLSERVDKINGDLSGRLDKIDAHIKDTKERAEVYADELFALNETVAGLRAEKFGYGKSAQSLKTVCQNVRDNLEKENFEAALALSQREVLNAMDIVAALTLLNNDFNRGLNRAKMKESELLETYEEYSAENIISYTDSGGEKKSVSFDIDHWSKGALSAAGDEFEEIGKIMAAAEGNSFGMRELQALENRLEALEEALDDAEALARDEFFLSCNVESIAVKLNRVMSDEGYLLEENGFYEGDQRESFNMTYSDDSGNKVAFVIAADEGDLAQIAMETYGKDPEDDEIKEITRCAVCDALAENDLKVGATKVSEKCNSASSHREFIEKVSKRRRKKN